MLPTEKGLMTPRHELEKMVDTIGISAILRILALICKAKGERPGSTALRNAWHGMAIKIAKIDFNS